MPGEAGTECGRGPAPAAGRADVLALPALLLGVLALHAWRLSSQSPFSGYDIEGHLYYVATLVDTGRLPHPLEGWSTFHPPLYYLLAALIAWPTAPIWPVPWLGTVSTVSMLAVGALAFAAVRWLGHGVAVATCAAALCLLVPCAQLTATMIGNEALAAAFAAFAALAGLRLHARPRAAGRAAATGIAVGLALATKFTGIFALPALVVPYLRRDLDRACLRAAAVGALLLACIAAAPYLRNLALTGSPLPMTRDREPVASVERQLTIRERRVTDYLWLDPAVFRAPVAALPLEERSRGRLNPVMTNVPGLLYASAWYDAHEVRVPALGRARSARLGQVLLLAGLVPTGLLMLGGLLSLRDLVRNGLRDPAAPLTAMAMLGVIGFVAFTARAPATAAVKASYLLPLAVPFAAFTARGVDALGGSLRRAALALCAIALLAAAVLFAPGVVLPVQEPGPREKPRWMSPGIAEVATRLDAASVGRWIGIRAEPRLRGGVSWGLRARTPPAALREDEVARWCEYLEDAMDEAAPGQPWRATIVQGEDRRRCAIPSRRERTDE